MTGFIWLIVLAVCLVIEIATYGLVTIWFAGGALVTFFVSLLTDNLAVQIVIFLVVSLIMLIFTRPIAMKLVNGKRTRTNVDSVIGKICKVTETIDNFNETGTIQLNGLEWTARSVNGELLSEGTKVRICSVAGVKVFVEEVK